MTPQHAERMEAVRAPRALLPVMLCISVRAEHAMRDLIASNAPLREGRHKARPVSTKPLTPGDSRGRSPLARLSPPSFVVQRKMGPSETVGLAERQVNPYYLNQKNRRTVSGASFVFPRCIKSAQMSSSQTPTASASRWTAAWRSSPRWPTACRLPPCSSP